MLGKPPTPPLGAPESPSRRFTDAVDPKTTVVGPGTRIKGELVSDDPVEIAGTLDGDARVSAHCHVRQGARVTGRVEAKSLVVEGHVSGPGLVADKLEIRSTARVESNVQARLVAIADGAFFEGEVRMDEPGGPVTFKEKRRVEP
jgi:cytoskeletal protein CcmA (bactofilin family)